MAASLDKAHVEKKFKGVTTTQESIQSLSMWVMHHKAQHEKIVDIWFEVLKKSKLDHRLTMFYLCNDIVQMCRRKHAVMYKDAFKEVLKDATLFVRDGTVRPAIERIFKIWAERGVYDEEFTEELVAIINNTKVRSTVNSKLLAEFQPLVLMEKVITLKRFEDEIELKRRQLVSLRMDASSVEAVRQLKDRTHGGEFCAEFESACTKMEDYVKSLEKEIADRTVLIEMLEQSELYYDSQYGEAKIVANAYKNFGGRVGNLQKKLEEKALTLPDSVSPVPSPPAYDAPSPSPDNSPIANNDEPYIPDLTESPIPPGVTTPEHVGQSYDMNTQHVDMEMSDEETEHVAQTGKNIAEEDSHQPSLSPRSDDDDMAGPEGSPLVVDKEDKKAAYIPSVAQGASSSFLDIMSVTNSKEKESDGGSTPVMDEFDTDSPNSKKKDNKEETKPVKQRPIDFLASLIGQSNNSSESSSSSFFKNLSVFTESVKSKIETDDKVDQPSNTADQWAAWKALQGPPAKLSPPQTIVAPPQPLPPTPPTVLPPQLPPPPRIHPSLMPMPTPPFPSPLPPPPVLPSQQEPLPPNPTPTYPPPPQMDTHYPPPPQHGYNVPPQGSNFPGPSPGQQDSSYQPPQAPVPPASNSYRPPGPDRSYNNHPQHDSSTRYVSPPVSTATSPSYPAPPTPQNSQNYQGQTTPPTSYVGGPPPPLTPTTPTPGFPTTDSYQQPRMYNPAPPAPAPPSFPRSANPNNYAALRTFTPQSTFLAPPPTPPLQQGNGPRFPGGGDPNPPSQRRDSWASSNEPPSPQHSVQFQPSTHRSNLTTIKTVDDQELNASPNKNTTTIPTLGQGSLRPGVQNSNSTGMLSNPADTQQPPSPTTPDRRLGGRGDEGQMEFIEKLKMKSSNQAANHSSNLRILTEVPMEQSEHQYHHHTPPAKSTDVHTLQREQHQQQGTRIDPDEVKSTKLSQEEARMHEEGDVDEAEDDFSDKAEDNDEENNGSERRGTVSQAVGNFLQQIRQEAHDDSNIDEEEEPKQHQSPTSHHHHPYQKNFNTDRNHHLNQGGFRQPPPHLSHFQSPFGPIGGGGGNKNDEQHHFRGSRFRMRQPEGISPRHFPGPRSPFGRPPQRGHFGQRQFAGGFPNKRPSLGMSGRPYFPRPRY